MTFLSRRNAAVAIAAHAKGRFVRSAVIGSTKMLPDRSMSALGKLHRVDATHGQWPERAVRVDDIWAKRPRWREVKNGGFESIVTDAALGRNGYF